MSTRHSRVANREALACPGQDSRRGVPVRTGLSGTGTGSNDPRQFGLKVAPKIGSGNIAAVEHASDSDGDRNSNDMDGRVPIDSHSSFATRH